MTLQVLIRCPNCGSTNVKPIPEPEDDSNTLCVNCGHRFKWEDNEE